MRLIDAEADECRTCGFCEDGQCLCPPYDKWYACPYESEKPENVQALKEYAEWCREREEAI